MGDRCDGYVGLCTPPPAPAVGQRYAIGRSADGAWSIWNAVTGGAAVKQFDSSDAGWQTAWREFRKLEKPPPNVTWFIGGFVPLDFS